MLVNKLKLKKSSGFTIIEVMIVLGIAAAIMLIVLIAIPQLQRNQRNTARKDIAGRISTEISNYAGNNNGELPLAVAAGVKGFDAFRTRYLTNINIKDPRQGSDFTFKYAGTADLNTSAAPGVIVYMVNNVCDGENPTATGASGRNFILQMALEGGAFFCLDNK